MVDYQVYDPDNFSILDFLPEFFEAFTKQITEADERWGDEWLHRPVIASQKFANQDDRIYGRFEEYYERAHEDDMLIDRSTWLDIVGNSFIAWVRLNHPELFPFGLVDQLRRREE